MKIEFTFGKSRETRPPDPETPFRILVLGDLDGRTSRNLTQPLADRRPVPVDLDSFESFLKRLRAEVQLGLPGSAPVRRAVSELDYLHPDRLFERMDLFTTLRETRRQLLNPTTFAAAATEVRSWTSTNPTIAPAAAQENKTPSPSRESDANTIERLLGHAPSPAPATRSVAAELIRKAVAPHIVAAPSGDKLALLANTTSY